MTDPIRVTTQVEVALDLETAAKWFSGLSDDEMCKFFVLVADEAERWPRNLMNVGPEMMWYFVGGHLRNCTCSTDAAREMIRGIAAAMDRPENTHGARA